MRRDPARPLQAPEAALGISDLSIAGDFGMRDDGVAIGGPKAAGKKPSGTLIALVQAQVGGDGGHPLVELIFWHSASSKEGSGKMLPT
jgi:hypothetical protein